MPFGQQKLRLRDAGVAYARDALVFTACYVALDWASYIYPLGPFNITPWNPPPALSIVWMLLGGLRYVPVVFGAAVIADIFVRHTPGGVLVSLLTSLVLAGGYAGIAAMLSGTFKFDAKLRDVRQLWILVLVTTTGAGLVAVLYVGVLLATGMLADASFADAAFRFWQGDAVGMLVTAPLLLVAADSDRRESLRLSWQRPETLLQVVVMMTAVALIFEVPVVEPSRYFYILFLPLIWIALRGGLAGAAVASVIVQIGVVLGAYDRTMNPPGVIELQALVAAFTLTGLSLGVMVDERERAAAQLKHSLRLAAAGEMAGAIAHEINQPLATLTNYGRACQLMLEQGEGRVPYAKLNAVIKKMLGESKRAADVVARLRDFFRTGSTRLEKVELLSLLERARHIGEELSRTGQVAFRVDGDGAGQMLLVDRLQIELVLRNLIANAFDAVASRPPGARQVRVSARCADGGDVVICVVDSGPGLTPTARMCLSEPYPTSKPAGMGLGLAISQAIAEAHGGMVTSVAGDHGEFHLVLPGAAADE
ncbi:MAG: MASE1 domain-containing protein [Betaproteobacteria bacterium]